MGFDKVVFGLFGFGKSPTGFLDKVSSFLRLF